MFIRVSAFSFSSFSVDTHLSTTGDTDLLKIQIDGHLSIIHFSSHQLKELKYLIYEESTVKYPSLCVCGMT